MNVLIIYKKKLEKIIEQDQIFTDIENEYKNMIRIFTKTKPKKY